MKQRLILLAVLLTALTAFPTTYVNENFESSTVGTNPVCSYSAPGGNSTNSWANPSSHVWVVTSSPIGSGKALEFIDNVSTQGNRAEWDLLPVTNGRVSSARFDFKFTPINVGGNGVNVCQAGMVITNGNVGSSQFRFFSLQMFDNGTVRARAGTASGGGNLNPILTVVSGTVYKVSMYANDGSSPITYTDPKGNSATNTLGADSVAFWIDGGAFTNYLFCTNNLASALSGTTNGLSKVGFASTTVNTNLYFFFDDIFASDVNYVSTPEYALTVNSGSGDGSYTNGKVVTIVADDSDTNKTFVAWTDDTASVANVNAATTTVTTTNHPLTVTATYNKGLLTVNNGTGGGYYNSGSQAAITANAPGAHQTFAKWVGDVANVADVYSATTTVNVGGVNLSLTASYAGFFHDYEDEATTGIVPTNGSPLTITQYPPDTFDQVVGSGANTAGTGQAVELKDNSFIGMGFEYNFTQSGVNISAARVSFDFSWKNLGANAAASMAASFGEYTSARSMSASASRWTEARLNDNGTVTISANGGTPSPDTAIQLVDRTANTLNVFANDYNSQSVNYKVNGTTYTLTPNSVAYWMNGQLVTFSNGLQGVAMDLTEVPLAGGTIETTENNLGKFGFSSSSATVGIDYIIDNFQAKALPATSEELYALVVNYGGSGGLYTNGQQVAIAAYTNAGKNFFRWRGDTQYVANVFAPNTTVTMPSAGVTLTAGYGENVLTVINGTGSGTYTNGQQVAIAANPAPAGKVFERWGGDVDIANVVNVFVTNTTLTMPLQDITVIAQYAGMFQNFENDTVGAVPTNGSPIVSSNVLVVAAGANTAGTGQAVEYIDNSPFASAGLEYNIAGSPGFSAAKASFSFSWKNLGGTNGDPIAASFGEYNGTAFKQLGSSARRWTEARLCNDGMVDFAASYVVGSVTNSFSNNNNSLVASNRNTLTIFANDYNSTSVTYTVNGTVYSLPANSVAYWLNGSAVLFGANPYAPMDLSDVNLAGQTIAASEGNLGKFGFSSMTSATGLDYILDDISVESSWSSLYSLVVNGGGGGGLYTNGQQVAISANPGRTFVAWIGDVSYLSANTANAVVTMPAAGVTLTAIYTDTILTVIGGTGSGSYTDGDAVPISASDTRPGVSFREWIGPGASYVANIYAPITLVLLPMQDITVIATYNYDLTVSNGTGSGSYTNGTVVQICADEVVGKAFVEWTGDTNVLASNAAYTTVIISTNPVSLTATYVDVYYNLTANNGTGSGSYTNGTVVQICADDPLPGIVFDRWVGDTAYLADPIAECTTLIMPAHDITLTATYRNITYTLTGQGSVGGSVSPTSTNVPFGGSATFTITASNSYRIATLTTNGTGIGIIFTDSSTSYTYIWSNVQYSGTLAATFTPQIEIPPPPFTLHGTPYSWLAGYGLTNYEADDLLDQDADGLKTWQEYIAGTVPTNGTSSFKATYKRQANGPVIQWNPVVTGRVYGVHWATNLLNSFQPLETNIVWPQASYTDTAYGAESLGFYEVKVKLVPFVQSQTNIVSAVNRVGYTRITLPPAGAYQLAGLSFVGTNNLNITFSELFGTNMLTKHALSGLADKVIPYVNNVYVQYYQRPDGAFRMVGGTAATNPVLNAGFAFWLQSPSGATLTNTIYLGGVVPATQTNTVVFKAGMTLFANPYPTDMDFNSSNLTWVAAGATANNISSSADKISIYNSATKAYTTYYLRASTGKWHRLGVGSWTNVVLPVAAGAWYDAKKTFTNSFVIP